MAIPSLSSSSIMFLGIIMGLVIGLVSSLGWEIWSFRSKNPAKSTRSPFEMHDGILIGLMIVAAFALGAFLTYALLNIHL